MERRFRIKELMLEKSKREQRKIRQKEIAHAIGVKQNVLSQIVNGVIQNPKIEHLEALSDYFGVTIDELMGREKSPRYKPIHVKPIDSLQETEAQLDMIMHEMIDVRKNVRDVARHDPIAAEELLKDVRRTIKTIKTASQSLPQTGLQKLTRLVGRGQELKWLLDCFQRLGEGKGQVVLLSGEAGVGKSRLVDELRPRFKREVLWLEGHSPEIAPAGGYGPFIPIFQELFGLQHAQEGKGLILYLKRLKREGYLSEAQLKEMIPLLGNLLDVQLDTNWKLRVKDAEQIKYRTFRAIHTLLIALSEKQGVAFVLEDMQLADSLAIELVNYLIAEAELIAKNPILLLCTYRPIAEDDKAPFSLLARNAIDRLGNRLVEVHLTTLNREAVDELVEILLEGSPPASVKEMVWETSQGNPLFVEELLRLLKESGTISAADGPRLKRGGALKAVPVTLPQVVLSRVECLDSTQRTVLQQASVLGVSFRRSVLEKLRNAIDDHPESDLNEVLEVLESHHFIDSEEPSGTYCFHNRRWEAVYEAIPPNERLRFHQIAAQTIEGIPDWSDPGFLAFHYTQSHNPEKTVMYLLKAGEKARGASLNDEAILYFRQALETLEQSSLGESRQEWRLEALKGLGRIYHAMGQELEQAEGYLCQAIALGKEMKFATDELVRLYFWLGDVLLWQNEGAQMIPLGKDGLALLGDATESVEAALMNSIVALGYRWEGDKRKWREFALRNTPFIQRLPYSEELRVAYILINDVHVDAQDVDEALKWLNLLKQKAEPHGDWRGLGQALLSQASLLAGIGDLHNATRHYQRAMELFQGIGDLKYMGQCLYLWGSTCLWLGDLLQAKKHAAQAFTINEAVGHQSYTALSRRLIGTACLGLGLWQETMEAFQEAAELHRKMGFRVEEARPLLFHARALLAQGKRKEALERLQGVIDPATSGGPFLIASVLSGMEEAYDDKEEFRAFCRPFRERDLESNHSPLIQWFLEPTEALNFSRHLVRDEFTHEPLSADWVWEDLFGDCSYKVQSGLEIHAANGRALWHINLSAPRILRPMSGDFAVQTVCGPVLESAIDTPAIGGLLLWKDRKNFLRFERGTTGAHDILLAGRLDNHDITIGRGCVSSERVFLRFERVGGRVNALCRADGSEWLTVGHVEFPVGDTVEVGLHAIGTIDRSIYHGAFPEGTAIRFESFQLETLSNRGVS
ncbi:AAA family ATPase [Candidatus Poribacteria bacterium]|nr:AAA family ATPase [Candidatus Poribacteria bacterium]